MDWLIWVIVIVLVVAIVWWLMTRNKAQNATPTPAGDARAAMSPGQPGTAPPAGMQPGTTPSIPDTATAAAGVAGLAGVANMGGPATEESQPTAEEPAVEEEPPTAVDDSSPGESPELAFVSTAGLTVEEPVIATPVVDEPVVDEPIVDTDAELHPAAAGDVDDWDTASSSDGADAFAEPAAAEAEPEPVSGVTADDVTRADDAAVSDAADKAEWESSWTDAGGAPIHHHEYTDAHSPTLPGAETGAAEDSGGSGHLAAEHPYGAGSTSTAAEGYPVKASATEMTYHDEDTPGYGEAVADVWFESAAHAEAAGFRAPRRSRH
ncbi:hypothetical protein ACFRJ9_17695 [Paenarthrobacter sp. NPDC056912]|uniref:sunset domain-containing protein n=1 Tax=Paenarthrobacter sp. NPDC056912 TaxID=3345965 RepID=UPI00367025C0